MFNLNPGPRKQKQNLHCCVWGWESGYFVKYPNCSTAQRNCRSVIVSKGEKSRPQKLRSEKTRSDWATRNIKQSSSVGCLLVCRLCGTENEARTGSILPGSSRNPGNGVNNFLWCFSVFSNVQGDLFKSEFLPFLSFLLARGLLLCFNLLCVVVALGALSHAVLQFCEILIPWKKRTLKSSRVARNERTNVDYECFPGFWAPHVPTTIADL